SGRASARAYAAMYLGLSNYTNNLLQFGFTERDIADGGTDRLIDAVIPHGSATEIAQVGHGHNEAGGAPTTCACSRSGSAASPGSSGPRSRGHSSCRPTAFRGRGVSRRRAP